MRRRFIRRVSIMGFLVSAAVSFAEEYPAVKLPPPRFEHDTPLMQVFRERQSLREFSAEKLPSQVLSNLLWAAFGVNRPETGGRTAPSAHDWQEIDVYVASSDGLDWFDAKAHALQRILAQDIRAVTGTQDFVAHAPVNLIYVADFTRMDAGLSPEEKKIAASADAGFIGENVYLYCAAARLATVVRGSIDRPSLAKTMKLKPTQWIVLAQSVGYPKK